MKKRIYLVRGNTTESYKEFKDRIFMLTDQLLSSDELSALKVVLTEAAPPGISIIPFKKKKVATISVYYKEGFLIPDFEQASGLVGEYLVTEALPVSYDKDWKDGTITPGVCLLTLFNQKKSISWDTFIDRWHNSHTPLSLKLHPLWNYNRNVVDKGAGENLEHWDGIVEEHVKTRDDLLNPFRFFGNPLRIIPNMISVYRDTKSFLDYDSIEPYLAMEYHIKS